MSAMPYMTKQVIDHLVSMNGGQEITDKIIKGLSLAQVRFDINDANCVINTITSVLQNVGSDVLPFEASQDFNQNSLVEGLNTKLKRSTDFATYNRLTVEMRNTKKEHITNVKDWNEVFNKAGNTALKTQRDT